MGFPFNRRPGWPAVVAVAIFVAGAPNSTPLAQQPYLHLNPVIEKLSRGEIPFGIQTSDFSLENARALARAPLDYVVMDFEHNPLDFSQIEFFLAGMVDKMEIVKKGNPQPNVAVIVEFPAYGREQVNWMIRQALDIGVMGFQFNSVDTKEQAEGFVQMMRIRRPKTDPFFAPQGRRFGGGGLAAWFWGVSGAEYQKHSDVWPLNPQGDLIAWPIIETAEGVQNADQIAQVPGITGLNLTTGTGLSFSLGVPSGDPAVEAAHMSVLKVCQARKIICGGRVTAGNIEKWIKAGYKFLNVGGSGGITPSADAALRVGRATLAATKNR